MNVNVKDLFCSHLNTLPSVLLAEINKGIQAIIDNRHEIIKNVVKGIAIATFAVIGGIAFGLTVGSAASLITATVLPVACVAGGIFLIGVAILEVGKMGKTYGLKPLL